MNVIETSQLTKRYGSTSALESCTLTVRQGEIFGLLGPNGSGKTTLIRLLMGFLRPTAGIARIQGLDTYRHAVTVHQNTAYLPGDVRLFRGMRARDFLRFMADVRRTSCRTDSETIARRLELDTGLRISAMSTGNRQKLALTAALSAGTAVIILDEPTANLDPDVRQEVSQLIREARDQGKTILLSSHVLDEVEDCSDRVAILRRGQIQLIQSISEIQRGHQIILHGIDASQLSLPPEVARITMVVAAAEQSPLSQVSVEPEENIALKKSTVLEVRGTLQPVLLWLSTLAVTDLRIEPIGLQQLYHAQPTGADERHASPDSRGAK